MALKYLTITVVLLITFTYTASAATIDIGTGEAFDFSSIQPKFDSFHSFMKRMSSHWIQFFVFLSGKPI